MESFIAWMHEAPLWQLAMAALAENVVVHAVAVALGEWGLRRLPHRRVALPPPPLSRGEVAITAVTLLTNTVTTLAGLYLWRLGIIRFRADTGLWVLFDVVVLVVVMDGAMYALHRVAHLPWIYPRLHKPHHEYDHPRPLSLFVLHPLENFAFGALMLAMFAIYPSSVPAMIFFVTYNIASGIVGHLGVEPLPDWWARAPLLRCLTGGSFHARHHQDVTCNFGFYTLIWDRLFQTLRRDYWARFGKLPTSEANDQPLP